MKKELFFIGSLGDSKNSVAGGAVVKNHILLRFLEPKYSKIIELNLSKGIKRNPLNFLKLIIYLSKPQKRQEIVLTAYMDLSYFILKICYYFPIKRKIIYSITGGYLPWRIEQGFYNIKYFRCVSHFICETEKMCDKMRSLGFENCTKLYNYKFRPKNEYFQLSTLLPIKFIYLGRIVADKGLPFLFQLWSNLNQSLQDRCPPLDIYGTVESNYYDMFQKELLKSKRVNYKETINLGNEKSYSIINQYTALLFPTEHQNEGFPGIIIDAAICGLPIITTPFINAQELILSRNLGFALPVGDVKAWADAIEKIIKNPASLNSYRMAGKIHAKDFYLENILTDDFWREISS